MPYIKDENGRRQQLAEGADAQSAGELNYQIFRYVKYSPKVDITIIRAFLSQFVGRTPNYQKYNDLTGAVVCCYLEIKRRLGKEADYLLDLLEEYSDEIARYEDLKITENGDV